MNEALLINPDTCEEYVDVPPMVAAEYLGVALNFIYKGLQKQTLPIGAAVQSDRGRWTYNIPCKRLKAYASGIDVLQTTDLIKQLLEKSA